MFQQMHLLVSVFLVKCLSLGYNSQLHCALLFHCSFIEALD